MATVETPRTEVRAEAKYVRAAPRKAQLVADQIRGRPVPEARTILAFMTRDAARDVEKVLASAVANAETNHGLVGDELYVSAAYVGAGPTLKRWRARARGRVARIRKRTCHITVRLALPGETPIPEPRGSVVLEPAAPEPEAPAETEVTGAEEAPKPRRAPRRKAAAAAEETAETAAEPKPKPRRRAAAAKADAETGEEKPKPRRRAAKPKTDDDAAEKPKRAARRKKGDES